RITYMEKQKKTPFYSKLKEYSSEDIVPFDVPGHKRGILETDLKLDVGPDIYKLDSNAPRGLDNLNHPKGVIKESEKLAALAFQADEAFFLTGGTTSGILAMMMLAVKAKQKIIMPRNVHKSIINGLILSGGIPVFIKPDMDNDLGIANGVSFEKYKNAIDDNEDAVAILVINPTYFGVVNDLDKIISYAHEKEMLVLADEAHGGNLYFSSELPKGAIHSGADISAVSMHKSLGSLTQSSILLTKGNKVDLRKLRSTLNIVQSTSPSQLLIASIDVARKTMFFEGHKLDGVVHIVDETINKINEIPGLKAVGKDYFIKKGAFDYDPTRLIIDFSRLGMTGFEAYRVLADDYKIQMELAESKIVLAVMSIGTTKEHLEKLLSALKDLSNKRYNSSIKTESKVIFVYPESYTRPREAYHAPYKIIKIEDSLNEIAAGSIMAYPPGIPLVIPGEIITREIIDALIEYKNNDQTILSDTEEGYIKVIDKDEWIKWEGFNDEI
ncbi:aminotransferase class I/II-fold pyridoxal phosphate-dependent enzyme, partial [Acholeplasma sp. OttesenSCG-928-E16]|nr:aminotransferase class I/II-fold pyridoxal phosphate-dependent enzyme [Acholeplasma sp. OttesenSCG-928-E16]